MLSYLRHHGAGLVLAAGCALAIAWLSLGPSSGGASAPGVDKIGHFVAYFVLTSLLLMAFRRPYWAIAVLASLVFGGLMEIGQFVLPYGREASWLDMAANAAGSASALLVMSGVRRALAR